MKEDVALWWKAFIGALATAMWSLPAQKTDTRRFAVYPAVWSGGLPPAGRISGI